MLDIQTLKDQNGIFHSAFFSKAYCILVTFTIFVRYNTVIVNVNTFQIIIIQMF